MLTEIRSDKFRQGVIAFHPGLNVVLGDENATNSIGKSTLLMIVDFAFGGNSLLEHNRDLAKELGEHDYFFTFQFEGESYKFRRGTFEPDLVHKCDEDFNEIGVMRLDQYCAFLKASYKIKIESFSFRALVGLYSRVWGKDNLNVYKPLHAVQSQPGRDCIDNLIKTFNRYESIRRLSERAAKKESEWKALRLAQRKDLIPRISTSERKSNEARIQEIDREVAEIRENLAKYATNIAEIVNREMLDLKVEKDELLSLRLSVESQLIRTRRNLAENRHIKSKHFAGLLTYFPSINQDRLARVEEFHSGVARLLGDELRATQKELTERLEMINQEVSAIDRRMAGALSKVSQPTKVVDRVYDLATSLRTVKAENEQYDREMGIEKEWTELRERLSAEKNNVVKQIESEINQGLEAVVLSIFGSARKSPVMHIGESSYSFDVFEDTGTGTAYANLIVFDLTVFRATALPFVCHDSLLFKNIENDSVANLVKEYGATERQSFIAIDEIEKYGKEVASLLRAKSVVQLDDDNVLYTKDWRTSRPN